VGKTRDIKDISSDDVNRYLNHLRDDLGNSPKTVLSVTIVQSEAESLKTA
jgi:hypothetical protein